MTVVCSTIRCVAEGFKYGEGLRNRDGRLLFSDMLDDRVLCVDERGTMTTFADGIARPSGLAFDADGNTFVVARGEDAVYRVSPDGVVDRVVELAPAGCVLANDMVSDGSGLLYVGCLGRPYELDDEYREWGPDGPGMLFAVDLRGPRPAVVQVAGGLVCPNGMVLTPDGSTLVVAETYGRRLTAFDRAPDGTLSNRRTLADTGAGQPDGLALDRDGGIWAGLPYAGEFARFDRAGMVTDRVAVTGEWAVACALGGPDRSVLYMAVCTTTMEDLLERRSRGRILAVDVSVPGAGWP